MQSSVNFQKLKVCETQPAARNVMRANRKVDSGPEVRLRRKLWSLGIRGYRKNYSGLPGKPDLFFSRRRLIVDIRGCFWHDCQICRAGRCIQTNSKYWLAKINKNVARDSENEAEWKRGGHTVVIVWEHEIKSELQAVVDRILAALE